VTLYGPKQLADGMRTVRKNTIQIAEDIPEQEYHHRPTPESRSVGELLGHILFLSGFDRLVHEKEHLTSLLGFDLGSLVKGSEAFEKMSRSKAEIVEMLRTDGELSALWMAQLPEGFLSEMVRQPGGASKSRLEMLLGTREHEIHHRAQLTVIERMLGIVPHLTRNRQATQASTNGNE
jgi:uncharacterized damage-inducible protein DinB